MLSKLVQTIRQKWSHLRLVNKFSLVVFAFVFIPVGALSLYISINARNTLIESKRLEVENQSKTRQNQVERTANLVNLSTQVVMNSSRLIEHLEYLDKDQAISLDDILNFQEREIKLFEKIVISNPYLSQLRIFSTNDNITEIMPILYASGRSKYNFGTNYQSEWFFNIEDQIYQFTRPVDHVMSLVSSINNPWGKQIGLAEISVRMDELFPTLFTQSSTTIDYFIDQYGVVHGNYSETWEQNRTRVEELDLVQTSTTKITDDFIIVTDWYPELKSYYVQLLPLTTINSQIAINSITQISLLFIMFMCVVLMVRRIFTNIFSDVNELFDTVNEFSMGDLDVRVPIKNGDEIGVVSQKINNVFDQMIELIDENIKREVVSKNAQIKALQSQINAHFIYNVLESIKMMAEINEQYLIADSISALGGMLHYSMHWKSQSASFKEEIDYTKNYLSLMNLRIDYDIILQIDLPDSLLNMSIPKVTLQPIIENTVLHGYESFIEEDQYIDLSVDVERNII